MSRIFRASFTSRNKGHRFWRVNKEKVKFRVKARQPTLDILDWSRVSLKEKGKERPEKAKA